jgi:uncharacterized protein YjdB
MRKKIILFLIVPILFLSCRKVGREDSMYGKIEFRLEYEDLYQTKVAPAVKEGEITDINILLYDEMGKFVSYIYTDNIREKLTMDIAVKRSYSIFAMANIGELPIAANLSSASDAVALFTEFANASSIVNSHGAIPMSCHIQLLRLDDGDMVTLPMKRLLSKFRIIVDKSGLDPSVTKFDIKQVRVRNLNTKVKLFSPSKAGSASDILDIGGSREGEDLSGIYTSGVDFYIPENMQGDLLPSNTDQRTHIPPEEKKGLCTYIEFTVDYRSSTQYDESLVYRYYLHDGRYLDNFDLVRNTMYTCRTTFTGSGINEVTWRIDPSSMKKLVTGITVSPASHTFTELGATKKFIATIEPVDAENNTVTWCSSSPTVASVDPSTGIVTAVSDGQCTITATANDGTGVSGSASVTVDSYVFPSSITVSPASAEIFPKETIQLTATVLPANANNKGVVWSTSDPYVATVSSSGLVTGVNAGTVTITATTIDKGLTATSSITVKERLFAMDDIPMLFPGHNSPYTITWSGTPSCTPVFSIEKISGEESLSISGTTLTAFYNGTREGGEVGRYRVRGTVDGITDEKEVVVNIGKLETNIPKTMYVGGTFGSESLAIPSEATLTWSSSDPNVAMFKNPLLGFITPVAPGKAIITARLSTGATCKTHINVVTPTVDIPESIQISEGESLQIPVTVYPDINNVRNSVRWSIISGESHISLENGVIKGISHTSGYDITVRAHLHFNPEIYDEVKVKVTPAISLSISGNSIMNSNISITNPVPSMPENLTLQCTNHTSAPVVWCLYDADGNSLNFENYFKVNSAGILYIPESSLASGKYSIAAYADGHYSNKVEIEVYYYLEYFIGYNSTKTPQITEMPEGMFTATYQIHSMFHPQSYSRLQERGREKMFEYKGAGEPNDAMYAIITYDNNRWWWICGEGNEITPIVTEQTYSGYYDPLTQTPFDVWRENIPHETLIKNPNTSDTIPGTEGTIVILSPQEYYFIRQNGEFHPF